ncbi:5-oxoprolinase subunit B family protein [Aneurinibacillus sp. REN35]|uniref:5-oxoprolinase subunit B family protein n=1 Tax=Aneurinibacillus sp. REN35 TaxID=3237286 RepID=UPI00352907A5
MLALAETRFSFVGDEYIYAEIAREMSVNAAFKALAVTRELHARRIPGVIDICPANASYLIRYNPDMLSPYDLMNYVKEIDINKSRPEALNLSSRIVEIPTWYNDPITREYSRRFQERNDNPYLSDFELVMRAYGFSDENEFIHAHTHRPYLLTMVGFILGTAWEFPLGRHISELADIPKYKSPRTETPRQAVSIGGPFTVVYPVQSSGSYQLIGITPVPVYQPEQKLPEFKDSMFLARPGDIWVHRPIKEHEYYAILSEVENGLYRYRTKAIDFSPIQYAKEHNAYIDSIMKGF